MTEADGRLREALTAEGLTEKTLQENIKAAEGRIRKLRQEKASKEEVN